MQHPEGRLVALSGPECAAPTRFGFFLDFDLSIAFCYGRGVLSIRAEGLEHLPYPFGERLWPLFVHQGGRGDEKGVCALAPLGIVGHDSGRAIDEMATSHGYELAGVGGVSEYGPRGQLHYEILCKRGTAEGYQLWWVAEHGKAVQHIRGYILLSPARLIRRELARAERAVEVGNEPFGRCGPFGRSGAPWEAVTYGSHVISGERLATAYDCDASVGRRPGELPDRRPGRP
jgi:hypothetical protein